MYFKVVEGSVQVNGNEIAGIATSKPAQFSVSSKTESPQSCKADTTISHKA
jgi:hypothetical protein